MDSSRDIGRSRHGVRGAALAVLAAVAASAVEGFYVFVLYGQNPNDLQQPRVHFWIAYTGAIVVGAAVAATDIPRYARVAFCSMALWGALVCAGVGMMSIGILYIAPVGLAVAALSRILDERPELTDLLLSSGALLLMVWLMVKGLQVFPLA